ncbi:MAG: hypothetical protein QM730_13230 [Anaerolineales bacterium]
MRNTILVILLFITITGCSAKPTETPVLADSAFSAQAFLDVNGNGQVDPKDTPVVNATFYVEINGVKAFGDATDENGSAFILIPGGVKYPVKVSMEAPKDSALKLISPSPVTVSASTGDVQFLFSK